MKREANARAFRKFFPWLDGFLPPVPGDYDFNEAPIDADILDQIPCRVSGTRKKHRIFLMSQVGSLLTEVREEIDSGWWRRPYVPAENVSQALERLGTAADDVGFIVTVGPTMTGLFSATVWHTRENTTIAKTWRRLAAQEQARVEKKLGDAFAPETVAVPA